MKKIETLLLVVSIFLLQRIHCQPAPSCTDSTSQYCDSGDYTYTESTSTSSNLRTINTNHCPNHEWFRMNPNSPVSQSTTYRIPLYPEIVTSSDYARSLASTGGSIGVLFDGAMIFSAYGGPSYGALESPESNINDYTTSAPYAEGDTFDFCAQHASSSSSASYHSHIPPPCLLAQLGQTDTSHSPQIGWSVDGFPVYGPRGPAGVMMKRCTESSADPVYCLDMCGGRESTTDIDDGYSYRYYIIGPYNADGTTDQCASDMWDADCSYDTMMEPYYPFTPLCLKGCCPSGVSCSFGNLPSCSSYTTSAGTTGSFSSSTSHSALSWYTPTDSCNCNDDWPSSCSHSNWETNHIVDSNCAVPTLDDAFTTTCSGAVSDGASCSITCNTQEGYVGTPDQETMTCSAGTFSTAPSSGCELGCVVPTLDDAFTISCSGAVASGTACSINCNTQEDYIGLPSQQTMTCNSGTFTTAPSSGCDKVCPLPTVIGASTTSTQVTSGQSCVWTAHVGYTCTNTQPLCQADGSWTAIPSCQGTRITVELTLNQDFSTYQADPDNWESMLIADIAAAATIDSSRINVLSVVEGSIVASLEIIDLDSQTGDNAETAANNLNNQMQDVNSDLLQGALTSDTTSFSVTTSYVCSDGSIESTSEDCPVEESEQESSLWDEIFGNAAFTTGLVGGIIALAIAGFLAYRRCTRGKEHANHIYDHNVPWESTTVQQRIMDQNNI